MTTPLQPAAHAPAMGTTAGAALPGNTAATAAANTYSDLNGLAALKKDPNSPAALHAVAQQVDALFLQMMLQSMREANAAIGGKQDSNEMGMYQDMFDKQIALTLSQHQGLGLGSLLARQLSHGSTPATPGSPLAPPRHLPGSGAASGPDAGRARGGGSGDHGQHGAIGGLGAAAPPGAGLTATPDAAQDDATPAAGATHLQHAAQFVSAVLPTIRGAAQTLGVSPIGLLAQAVLETGWGRRMAHTADGTPSLNLFGIKAGGGWTGARANATSVEFSGGVATRRHTAFRAYGSVEESVNDFAGLLAGSPRYAHAVAAGGDPHAYAVGIGRSGYATDPEYANKLTQVLDSPTFRAAVKIGLAKL